MQIGQKRIPLKSLHSFEAAGRHLSMGQAALELSVTQSAISHQVRHLEDQLGVKLFDRSKKQISLTPEGARLFAVVGKALEDIKLGAMSLDEETFAGKFTIAAPPAFTNLWLVPRVGELLDRFPDLELHFESMPRRIPSVLPEADLVVQFGKHNWPRKRIAPLAVTDYKPVCSPRLLSRLGKLSPGMLKDHVLIHDDDGEAWSQWLSVVGKEQLQPKRHMYVATAIDALELARLGVGFAMNDQIITSYWLGTGELIAPFRQGLSAYDSYYIITAHEGQMSNIVGEFETWLRQKIA
ncbi:MAG: LysR substrate-binding domain-containing protein [Pseudomonadales bacterium]